MKKIFIFGACSAIAQSTARLFAEKSCSFYLVDIDDLRLNIVRDELMAYGAKEVITHVGDAIKPEAMDEIVNDAIDSLRGLDIAFIAHGTLPDNDFASRNAKEAINQFKINALSVISLSIAAANCFEKNGHGTLAVISSVAGDRGRQSNFIYGSAKGAVTLFLEGLRNRFGRTDIRIITIKPGMVDTPMTAAMKKGLLFSKPDIIGKGIFEAIVKGKDTIYLPAYWRIVMFVIKLIPERIFKKLSL